MFQYEANLNRGYKYISKKANHEDLWLNPKSG